MLVCVAEESEGRGEASAREDFPSAKTEGHFLARPTSTIADCRPMGLANAWACPQEDQV